MNNAEPFAPKTYPSSGRIPLESVIYDYRLHMLTYHGAVPTRIAVTPAQYAYIERHGDQSVWWDHAVGYYVVDDTATAETLPE